MKIVSYVVIFEPNACGSEEGCVLMPKALTSVDTDNKVVLVLESHGSEPIYLEAGQMFGWMYDATICPGWEFGGRTDVNALPVLPLQFLGDQLIC